MPACLQPRVTMQDAIFATLFRVAIDADAQRFPVITQRHMQVAVEAQAEDEPEFIITPDTLCAMNTLQRCLAMTLHYNPSPSITRYVHSLDMTMGPCPITFNI